MFWHYAYIYLLQAVFDAPDLKRGAILNKDAAKMLQLTPHTYRQMVLDCVAASLRVQGQYIIYQYKCIIKLLKVEKHHMVKILVRDRYQ